MKAPAPKQLHLSYPSLKHPGRWLWLILAVPIVVGLARLRFDVEVFDLLPANLKTVQGLKLYQEHFANARELILTLQGPDAEQTEAAAQTIAEQLRQNQEVTGTVTWQPPWLEHPEQAAELMGYLWFNQPPDVFRELAQRLAPQNLPEILSAAREELSSSMSPQEIARLSYDPFGLTRLPETAAGAAPSFGQGQESFGSSDGTFRIVFVQARTDLRTYKDCQNFLDAARGMVEQVLAGAHSAVKPGFTGRPAFVAEVAAGMEHDITVSVGGTAVIIAILFYLAHRRVKPMLWLLTLLAAILGSTLALGGLIFGTINVVSMGFAAILLGLAVDYAVVHYQEALAHPSLTVPQIRHAIAPSIFWAATTTIAAFLVLNFGGLPGLGQLGTLVGLGVALAATIMIFEFLPPLFPGRNESGPVESQPHSHAASRTSDAQTRSRLAPSRIRAALMLGITAVVFFFTLLVLGVHGIPRIDTTANALRPRHSAAYAAVDQIQAHLSQQKEPLWLIVGGATVANVDVRLRQVQQVLNAGVSNGLIAGFTLPTPLWPRSEYQQENRAIARQLAAQGSVFRQAALTNGFATNALALTDRVLETWQRAGSSEGVFWPANPISQWIFDKLAARTPTNDFALGLINPINDAGTKHSRLATLEKELPHDQVWLSGWELLGSAIFSRVKDNMWKVVAPMVALVLLSLYLAFRRAPEILLSLTVLGLSGLCLLTVMKFAGWSWNLLNLMGIPLILGTGVDYSIFMLLALRRFRGDLTMAYNAVGRALLLCGGTAVAGFGSLSLSTNAGMASLGQVCAVGIGSNMLMAIFLLPVWWYQVELRRNPDARPAAGQAPSAPSSLYRRELWQVGQSFVRVLPAGLCAGLRRVLVALYYRLARHRREVVVRNLVPAVGEEAARAKAKTVFQNFGRKLIDLWRFEAGLAIDHLFGETTGWEHFEKARAARRGILLLTPHLGNWEFGGPLLTQRGFALQVLTLAEPGEQFTRLRQKSRARWNIETLVVGNDPLAFVEVIRRLEAGATVALLVDRPPPSSAVKVKLFGREFLASIAAAELARASGCALLPVYLPRNGERYDAHILPPIPYERASLRDRKARQQLTQAVMSVFEPKIRQNLDQWYHFVPVWPDSPKEEKLL